MLFDLIKPDLRVAFGFAGMHPSPSLYCLPHYYSYPSGDFLVCEEDVPFDRSRLERGEKHARKMTFGIWVQSGESFLISIAKYASETSTTDVGITGKQHCGQLHHGKHTCCV